MKYEKISHAAFAYFDSEIRGTTLRANAKEILMSDTIKKDVLTDTTTDEMLPSCDGMPCLEISLGQIFPPEQEEVIDEIADVVDRHPELFEEPKVSEEEMLEVADTIIDEVEEKADKAIERAEEQGDAAVEQMHKGSTDIKIRRADFRDATDVQQVIEEARNKIIEADIPQWKGGYPSIDIIKSDIRGGFCYVAVDDEDDILGTLAVTLGPDDEYEQINGRWMLDNESNYAIIHRCATSKKASRKGVMKKLFMFAEDVARACECGSIRLTTHETNQSMRGLAESLGYYVCGIVEISDGAEIDSQRVGYEKIIAQLDEELPEPACCDFVDA